MPTPSSAVLTEAIAGARMHLPSELAEAWEALFTSEHVERLAARLIACHVDGPPAAAPPPHLSVECTEPYGQVYAPFASMMGEAANGIDASALAPAVAEALQRAGLSAVLVLLGQRVTPASLRDAQAIPPRRSVLMAAATAPHAESDPALSVAGRALAKHAHRNPDRFWGDVVGSSAEKSEAARVAIERILADVTWWNVFGHFQHVVVFEARTRSGHGVRWGHHGTRLIGFLEPFDESKGALGNG